MGLYLYQNPLTGEVKEVVQTMREKHEYSDCGVNWKRIYQNPQISIDSQIINPYSKEEFLSKTVQKRDKVGDWWSRSQELSQKRADKDGLDPVKEQYYKDYAKKRKGKQLLEVRRRKVKDKLDKMGVILE